MVNKLKRIIPASTEPSIARYLNQKGCLLGLPTSGNFELTARCNFDCKMCYVHRKDDIERIKSLELSTDQWLSLASDARDQGMVFLLLTGGEPFLREDFEIIYRELIKMGLMISINTNASLYDNDIRKLLQVYPPSRVNVTLYGGSEETYKSLCGNAAYEKVIRNLQNMKDDGLQVRLNVSLTPYNVKDIEKIDMASQQLELHAKATSYMYPPVRINGTTGVNPGRFCADEAGVCMASWHKLRDTPEMFTQRADRIKNYQNCGDSESCVEVEAEGVQCRAGRSSFWMTWDGKMLPCGIMEIEPSDPIRDGFVTAWKETREKVSGIKLPVECASCNWRNNCAVCAANCKAETGSFDKKPAYLCEMTKAYCNKIIELDEFAKLQL